MLRIVRLCGVLMVAGLAVSVAQCAKPGGGPGQLAVQQPSRYMDCGPVTAPAATFQQIGSAGGVIANGPHMIIFPPNALPGDRNVTLVRVASNGNQNRAGVRLTIAPQVEEFGADVSVLLNVAGCANTGDPNWKIYRVTGNNPDGPGTPKVPERTGDYFHIFTRVHSFLIIAD